MGPVLVKNADRMMTSANCVGDGIEITFADGHRGIVPFAEIPEVGAPANLAGIELPSLYEVVLRNTRGQTVEIPWDFARHYADVSYRPRVEVLAAAGRQAIGARIRSLRESARLTQQHLATAAGLGRVTLVRIEKGEQSPRYETLVALARAMGKTMGELISGSAGRES